jgi:hypothetical protein
MKMAKMVKMFELGEEVMIKVEIADVKVVKGEVKYILKDPLTAKTFDYLYTDEQIFEIEKKPATKKGTNKCEKTSNG